MSITVRRYLVVFKSEASPSGEVDVDVADVRADGPVRAIAMAKRQSPPQHPWVFAVAVAWPKGCRTVDAALLAVGT